jgi:signal transduction histidine kinase
MARLEHLSWRRHPWVWVLSLIALSWTVILSTLVQTPVAQGANGGPHPVSTQRANVDEALLRLVPRVNLLRGPTEQPLRPTLAHWEDKTGQATFAQARAQLLAGQFKSRAVPHAAGARSTAFWYAVAARRTDIEQGRWLAVIGMPYLDDVQVWVERGNGRIDHIQLGDHFLAQGRQIHARHHTVGINLQPDEEIVIWVRARTDGTMRFTFWLDTPAHYFNTEVTTAALLGMFIGVLLLGCLTYALISLWLRDMMLGFYSLFLATLVLLYAGQTGLLIQLVQLPPWWLNDLFAGFGTTGPWYAAGVLWVLCLEMDTHQPRLARTYRMLALLFAMALPLALTPHYNKVVNIGFLMGVVSSPLILYCAWVAWRRMHDRLRMVYLIAFLSYQIGGIVLAASLLGLLPSNELTTNIYPAATLFHTLVMAVAMGMRISRERSDKTLAHERAEAHQRFVAMLTHEFRNPLASIDRSANLLQALQSPTGEQLHSRMANVRQQVRRLSTLVDGFLTVGHDDRSPITPMPTEVKLHEWLSSLIQAMGPDMGARVLLEMPQGDLRANLDPKLMRLALNNLLDNALRYSPDDGVVRLVAQANDTGGVRIAVMDQGPGLSENEMKRLGTTYHLAGTLPRGQRSAGSQGTGLGYFFCRQIVEAHGGQITPSTLQPHGLCVTITIP